MGSGSRRHGQLFSRSGPKAHCVFPRHLLNERKALLSGLALHNSFLSTFLVFSKGASRTHTVLRRRGHRPWCCFLFFVGGEDDYQGHWSEVIGFKLLGLPCQQMVSGTEKCPRVVFCYSAQPKAVVYSANGAEQKLRVFVFHAKGSPIAYQASVPVQFRSKERGTRVSCESRRPHKKWCE